MTSTQGPSSGKKSPAEDSTAMDEGESLQGEELADLDDPVGQLTGFDVAWDNLRLGDPAPFVALFDLLLASDFPFAAGGILRDLADRIVDADDVFDDVAERERFVDTAKKAILTCEDGDEAALKSILDEAVNAE